MAQPSVHGRFIWQELMTDDTAGAAEFYSKVVGWRVQPPIPAHGDYRVFAAGRHEVGGVMSLPQHARDAGARPHWLPYIGADDVDATVARVEQLGGKVLRAAADVQNVGRYAVLADPQGAAFGIYRPQRPAPTPGAEPAHGEFAWQELATSDFEAAYHFYAELFGWHSLQRMDMGPAGTYLIFGRDGVRHGGIYKLSAQTPAPYWLSYINVADADATVTQARERGARVVTGPMDVPGGGRIAQLLDGSGVLFAVHSTLAATKAPEAATPKQPAKRARAPAAGGASAPTTRAAQPAESAPPAKRASAAASSPSQPAAKSPAAKPVAKKPAARKAASKKVASKAAKKAGKKAGKKVAKKAAKKVAKKVAKKAVRKAPLRRAAAKRGRKAVTKVAKRAAKKSAAKAGRRGGRVARRGKARHR